MVLRDMLSTQTLTSCPTWLRSYSSVFHQKISITSRELECGHTVFLFNSWNLISSARRMWLAFCYLVFFSPWRVKHEQIFANLTCNLSFLLCCVVSSTWLLCEVGDGAIAVRGHSQALSTLPLGFAFINRSILLNIFAARKHFLCHHKTSAVLDLINLLNLHSLVMEFKTEQVQFQQCQVNPPEVAEKMHQRRSANYKPNVWKYDFLQSLNSKYDFVTFYFVPSALMSSS